MDDGQKVITLTHPEHSSGELKKVDTTGYLCLFVCVEVLWVS